MMAALRRFWELVNREPDAHGRIPAAPRDAVMVESQETFDLELEARLLAAAEVIEQGLLAQGELLEEDRNGELVDALLDLRSALFPSSPGSQVLRELPPLPQRHGAQGIPGCPS